MNTPGQFAIKLFLFTLVLGAFAFALTFALPASFFSPSLPFLFPFFFSISYIVFLFLSRKSDKFSKYVNRFMAATFIKLMVYMAVLIIYAFSFRQDAIKFIVSFFILYLAYTIFDVIALLKQTKKPS